MICWWTITTLETLLWVKYIFDPFSESISRRIFTISTASNESSNNSRPNLPTLPSGHSSKSSGQSHCAGGSSTQPQMRCGQCNLFNVPCMVYLLIFGCFFPKLGASGIELVNLHMAISTAGSQSFMGCSFFWNNWTPTSLPKTKARTKIKRWKGSVLFLAGLDSTTTTEVRFVPFSMAKRTGDWENLMRSGVVWICVDQSLIPQYVFNLKLPGVDLRANFRHVPIKYIFLQQVHCSSLNSLREFPNFSNVKTR